MNLTPVHPGHPGGTTAGRLTQGLGFAHPEVLAHCQAPMLDLARMIDHRSLLEAALIGYQYQRDRIEAKIAEVRHELGGEAGSVTLSANPVPAVMVPKQRVISAAGRRRIAAAQRKRWAALKASKESQPKKRKLSVAGRKRIADATRKRWAEVRAKKAVKLARKKSVV